MHDEAQRQHLEDEFTRKDDGDNAVDDAQHLRWRYEGIEKEKRSQYLAHR